MCVHDCVCMWACVYKWPVCLRAPAGAFVPLSFSRPVCISRQLDGELIRARITNSTKYMQQTTIKQVRAVALAADFINKKYTFVTMQRGVNKTDLV